MNGPQHYKAGEAAHQKAQRAGKARDGASAVLYMQAAQWHASMAMVAAIASTVEGVIPYATEWNQVLRAEPEEEQ